MRQVKSGAIILAFCWAHVRRDFLAVLTGWPELTDWAWSWVEDIALLYERNDARLDALTAINPTAAAATAADQSATAAPAADSPRAAAMAADQPMTTAMAADNPPAADSPRGVPRRPLTDRGPPQRLLTSQQPPRWILTSRWPLKARQSLTARGAP